MTIAATKKLCCIASIVALPLVTACTPGGPIAITTGYGPEIKFSGLGPNYAWSPEPSEKRLGAPGLHEAVQEFVEKNLTRKRFTLNSAAPNFWVDYRVARREKTDASVIAHGQTVEEGSLILEVIDPPSRKNIWWGIARAQIRDSDSPEERRSRLEAAISQLMQKFPEKAK